MKNHLWFVLLVMPHVRKGEVSEAIKMATLKKLPIIFFVQDNEWDISANAKEIRAQDMTQFERV